MDVLPTILELARLPHPGSHFRGREVVIPRGKSWVSHLGSDDLKNTSVHKEDVHIHGWELFGQRAIREGNWKAVWIGKPRGNDEWELYDVESDPSESNDVAESKQDVLHRLIQHWEQYYAETGMVQTPAFGSRGRM
jgi:arylsulfatase